MFFMNNKSEKSITYFQDFRMKSIKILIFFLCTFNLLFGQYTVAVIDFTPNGITISDSKALSDRFRDELFKTKKCRVVERELMDTILKEQGFQISGCTSSECVVEVGQLLGVEKMISGSISKVGNVYSISARIIDVETGEIFNVANYDYAGNIGRLLTDGIRESVINLLNLRYSDRNYSNIDSSNESISLKKVAICLKINTIPTGAGIWIDNKYIGKTPLTCNQVQYGNTYKIKIRKFGYPTGQGSVTMDKIEEKTLFFDLEKYRY